MLWPLPYSTHTLWLLRRSRHANALPLLLLQKGKQHLPLIPHLVTSSDHYPTVTTPFSPWEVHAILTYSTFPWLQKGKKATRYVFRLLFQPARCFIHPDKTLHWPFPQRNVKPASMVYVVMDSDRILPVISLLAASGWNLIMHWSKKYS